MGSKNGSCSLRQRKAFFLLIKRASEECEEVLQAYRLKKPGNFGQHFLGNGSCYGQMEGRNPTRVCLERVPVRFFPRKNVGVAKSPSTIRKTHFLSRRGILDSTAREARFLEKFGGTVPQRDVICRSVSKPQKNPRALCQSNVTMIERLRAGSRCESDANSKKSTIFEIISRGRSCSVTTLLQA